MTAPPDVKQQQDKKYYSLTETLERHIESQIAGREYETKSQFPYSYPLTDSGNAELFVDNWSNLVAYNHTSNHWLIWDGKRWKADHKGEINQAALLSVRGILSKAAKENNPTRREELVKHEQRSEGAQRLKAIIDLAKNDPRIASTSNEYDKDIDKINTLSGEVDLKTGRLSPHNPKSKYSKIIPVEYNPELLEKDNHGIHGYTLHAPLFTKFLIQVTCGRTDLIEYLQVIVGYIISGRIVEHVAWIFFGSGENGKGVFTGILLAILGEYATAPAADLMVETRNGGATPEIASLYGIRFASVQETDDGGRLSEARFKWVTGGDPLTGRYLYGNPFTFIPTHKLILSTNHKLRITTGGHSIWRRIRLIPWDLRLSENEIDKLLPEKLKAEYPAILAWMIHGSLKWYRDGIPYSKTVDRASREYQQEQDRILPWMEDKCTTNAIVSSQRTPLYQSYEKWCEDESERAMSAQAFYSALEERGYQQKRRIFYGISLKI